MGKLVISIDFELRWGVLDKVQSDIDNYKNNLLSVHDNVPWMLKIFEERGIAATWATVGAVGCDDWDEFDKVKPKIEPSYQNKDMIYNNDFNRVIDPHGELYFAPKLIKKIVETSRQELGTHTFGHIYGTEPDVTYEEFKMDLLICKDFLSQKFGCIPESLVFPRNQVIYENQLIQDNVIKTFRGNETVDYMSTTNQREKKLLNRIKILWSALNPHMLHAYDQSNIVKGNVQASAMFRIYLSNLLRKVHLYKLKQNIKNLGSNEIYHIWFHPHNLGTSEKKKDDFVRFFDFIAERINIGQLQSESMSSLLLKVNS